MFYQITGFGNGDTLVGNVGSDIIRSSDGQDLLFGYSGDDQINGMATSSGGDTIIAGVGADTVNGTSGSDFIWADKMTSESIEAKISLFSQAVNAASKISVLYRESLDLGEGKGDTVNSGTGTDIVFGGNGKDSINGGDGADTLTGDGAIDTLLGGLGNDILFGGSDGDMLNGNGGDDIAAYWLSSETGIKIDMSTTAASTGGAKNDTYISIEEIQGTLGNDTITGSTSGDLKKIRGDGDPAQTNTGGNDSIVAGDNAIDVYGGRGADTIFGGYLDTSGLQKDDNKRDHLYGEDGSDTYQAVANSTARTVMHATADRPGDPYYMVGAIDFSKWANCDVIHGVDRNQDKLMIEASFLTGKPVVDVFEFNAGMDDPFYRQTPNDVYNLKLNGANIGVTVAHVGGDSYLFRGGAGEVDGYLDPIVIIKDYTFGGIIMP